MPPTVMKLLLHACCAPCSAGALMKLNRLDIHPVLYWNNPNIHPLLEYKARLDALREFAAREHLPLVVDGEYGLRPFAKAVAADPDDRCRHCYQMRLDAAARHAQAHGFEAFSTTLSISPYQDAGLIAEYGEQAGDRWGVRFELFDFTPYFRAGQEKMRSMDLYLQKYCGCIYSEEERYERKKARNPTGFYPNFRGPGSRKVSRRPANPAEGMDRETREQA